MAETILFESILISADCYATESGDKPGWILKFENGAIVRADQGGPEALKGEVWWMGRKYRVKWQMAGLVATKQHLVAELIQEEPIK